MKKILAGVILAGALVFYVVPATAEVDIHIGIPGIFPPVYVQPPVMVVPPNEYYGYPRYTYPYSEPRYYYPQPYRGHKGHHGHKGHKYYYYER